MLTIGNDRPRAVQVFIEAETQGGQRHSILLQNAETVRLVGPPAVDSLVASHTSSLDHANMPEPPQESRSQPVQCEAVSVSELQLGQTVYIHMQGAARHTGISIQENIVEK